MNVTTREYVVKTFVIDRVDNVAVYAGSAPLPEGTAAFASEKQWAALVADWPLARLVGVWNGLPGLQPVSKFTDRATAVHRIWRAVQKLEPAGTKTERMVALLRQPSGATLRELMAATGWQPHSVRGFISAQVSKKMGFRINSFKREGERVYRIVRNRTSRKNRRKERRA